MVSKLSEKEHQNRETIPKAMAGLRDGTYKTLYRRDVESSLEGVSGTLEKGQGGAPVSEEVESGSGDVSGSRRMTRRRLKGIRPVPDHPDLIFDSVNALGRATRYASASLPGFSWTKQRDRCAGDFPLITIRCAPMQETQYKRAEFTDAHQLEIRLFPRT